ncbi:sensor histidine kinase [Planctomicrobium sp. SH668]|uniref:sensor histidine kinase n=1 Tax=Planctomicrobium sp. SH668 TaxID=3448126 RepID=UPI003F5B74EC
MRCRLLFALVSCFALVSLTTEALAVDPARTLTQAFVRKWQSSQGLPHPSIVCIKQTSDGRLWLGTPSGLYQFDGIRFSAPLENDDPSRGSDWVNCIVEGSDNSLWIGTLGNGLLRWHQGKVTRMVELERLAARNITAIRAARDGELWVATESGLYCGSDDQFARVTDTPNVTTICESRSGEIIIGTDDGQLLFRVNGSFEERKLHTVHAPYSIRVILETPDERLYLATSDGLVVLSGQEEKRITRYQGLADNNIETIELSHAGELWVGTRNGLSRISNDQIETLRSRDGLTQSRVLSLCEDSEQSLWVGTKNGLNQIADRRTVPLTKSEGLPSNDIGALIQSETGQVWIGTLDAGLARFNGRACDAFFRKGSGLAGNLVSTLTIGKDRELWVGTDQGLNQIVDGKVTRQFTTDDGLPANPVLSLCYDNSGNSNDLWIGTARGLARMTNHQLSPLGAESALSGLPVIALLKTSSLGILVATDGGGIYQIQGDQLKPWNAHLAEILSVSSILQGQGNQIWISTLGKGLILIDGDRVTRYSVRQGLYDDEITGLIFDDQDRLWFACSRGAFFVPQSELIEFSENRRRRITSTPFTPMESQRTIECQSGVQPSIWKMDDGKIWIATNYGVIIVDPHNIQRHLPLPKVHLEQIQVNGQDQDLSRSGQLKAGMTNLMFRYSAMSFVAPMRTMFRYQLKGFDEDWVDAGSRREAYYTNLPPGQYQFQVMASTPQGEWSEPVESSEFVIRQVFYKTPLFYCLLLCGLLAAAWGVTRLRVYQVRTRLNAALEERMRIARDLHDTLIQGFTGVTMQLQAYTSLLKDSKEKANFQELIQDSSRCLKEARQIVTGLRHTPGSSSGLVKAIEQTARELTETHDLHLNLSVPESVPPLPADTEYNLLRIIQEALTNSVKHANASVITLTLESRDNQIALYIADDGVGFAIEGPHQKPGHYGLIGIRERAHQIQAQISIQSRLGKGTFIELILPRTSP